jgi:hypothetical protein
MKFADTWRGVKEKSKFMANRMENMDREFKDSVHGLRLEEGVSSKVKQTSMKGLEFVQLAIDMPKHCRDYGITVHGGGD